ncbi:MAG: U32 family peptidase [Syntrophobacterales bacterium]|nr:U32 family peptidase [Syntrophobacterales bacterium]
MGAPELLAPAGSIETFWTAFEAGADAVYVGIRGWNARAFADNFTLDECTDLLAWAESRRKRIYFALNSLILSNELESLHSLLAEISSFVSFKSFGGLIVQDAGVVFLSKRFFPGIPLHLSTLSGIHNLQGVEMAARWGIKRVVLAREVPLDEAISIAQRASIEVEVFVHGALCFSFSGLCIASSFRGGRSGLRGECAQPCRLRFRQGHREGFFLSCNDFSALHFIPELKRSKIAALKIEGRMKSPDYVKMVVKAYRMVLDAKPEDEKERMLQAEDLLRRAPSRRLSPGFWSENPSQDVLSPKLSGTSGIWVGTIESKEGNRVIIRSKRGLHLGDIVRPETSKGREERLREIIKISKLGDELFELEGFSDLPVGAKLFFVGRKGERPHLVWKRIRSEISQGISLKPPPSTSLRDMLEELPDKRRALRRGGTKLIVKISNPEILPSVFHSPARWIILKATLHNLESLAKMRILDAQKERLVLSLPTPIVGWTQRMKIYERAIGWFISRGFLLWEINNTSHLEVLQKLTENRQKIGIFGGIRLNVRNPAALFHWAQQGCFAISLSVDVTKGELLEFIKYPMPAVPIVTVYSWPSLMVSILEPKLMEMKPFITEKGERYYYSRNGALSFIYADRPISLFGKLGELINMGYHYFAIDLSEGPRDLSKDLSRLLSGFEHERDDKPFTDCNWNLNLVKEVSHDKRM